MTLAEELASRNPVVVIDVRMPREWSAKHLSGSTNLPLAHLQERIGEVPRSRRIAVHCTGDSGFRADTVSEKKLPDQAGIYFQPPEGQKTNSG